jgi:molybdopterin converting factor small subunit
MVPETPKPHDGSTLVDRLLMLQRTISSSNPTQVKIRFYGRLSELIGREIDLDAAESISVGDLLRQLAQAHANAASALLNPRVRAVVADEIVPQDFILGPRDELEILPIVSGG